MSGVATLCEILSAGVLCAAALTALMTNVEPDKRPVVANQAPPPASQSVRQEGTVIAVSPNSVTARSGNGYTQTYLLNPNTTVITRSGSQPAAAASW